MRKRYFCIVVCRIFFTSNASNARQIVPGVEVEVDPPGVRAGETRPAPRTAQPRTAGARTIAIHPCSLLRPASAAHTAVSANLGFCEDCPLSDCHHSRSLSAPPPGARILTLCSSNQ